MDLIFGYLAGLLTLINPCVLPVLPIVLASALQSSRWGPVALTLGLSVSFVTVGMVFAVFGRSLGVTDTALARGGAIAMIGFGAIILIPQLSSRFSLATSGFSAGADKRFCRIDQSTLSGQVIGGVLLGVVWVPCVGPTLGGAIALASAGESLSLSAGIMTSFALGISTVILVLAYGAQSAIRRRRDMLRAFATRARPAMGLIFVLTGLAIWFDAFRAAEIWLLDTLPYWLQDLSVRF